MLAVQAEYRSPETEKEILMLASGLYVYLHSHIDTHNPISSTLRLGCPGTVKTIHSTPVANIK